MTRTLPSLPDMIALAARAKARVKATARGRSMVTPSAYMDVEGEWNRSGGALCWDCGGILAPQETFHEIEDERDELADDLVAAKAKVGDVRLALRGMIDLYERAAGNCALPEYQAAIAILADGDGGDG